MRDDKIVKEQLMAELENLCQNFFELKGAQAGLGLSTEALLETVETYRYLVDHSPQPISVITADGKVLFANQALAKLLGLRNPGEIIGRLVTQWVPRDSRDSYLQKIEEMQDRPADKRGFVEGRFVSTDGEEVVVELSAARITFRGKDAIQLGIRDISERKRIEEGLRKTEAQLSLVFDGMSSGLMVLDATASIVLVNRAGRAILELPEGVRGENLVKACPAAEPFLGDVAPDERKEVEILLPNGLSKTIGFSSTVVHDQGLRTVIFRDVTGILQNEDKKRQAEQYEIVAEIAPYCIPPERIAPPHPEEYPSRAMNAALAKARQAAKTDSIILLLGRSGSGKDHMARFIHSQSQRSGGPFFDINCAVVPPELAESELFGHEAGAFTGANKRKRGLVELAEGGTLLLNEIGELSLPLQAKLLTFLDTRTFSRVGGEKRITVNARLIFATNRDLEEEVESGGFRQDLFYRINVLSIEVPPLRERIEDIPILVREIVARLAAGMNLPRAPLIEPAATEILSQYDWPGNVRELCNVLERAVIVRRDGMIRASDIGLKKKTGDWSFTVTFPSDQTLNDLTRDMKRSVITEALRLSEGRRKEAAEMLGISRNSLLHYMKTLDIEA